MFGQNPSHYILVDLYAKGSRDYQRDAWTTEPRVAPFELDDGPNQFLRWSFWPRLSTCLWRKQSSVLATNEKLMKSEQGRHQVAEKATKYPGEFDLQPSDSALVCAPCEGPAVVGVGGDFQQRWLSHRHAQVVERLSRPNLPKRSKTLSSQAQTTQLSRHRQYCLRIDLV